MHELSGPFLSLSAQELRSRQYYTIWLEISEGTGNVEWLKYDKDRDPQYVLDR
jgi:hypothetical protein